MNFYRINNETHLFSFEDAIYEAPILGKPLKDVQAFNIEGAKGVVIDVKSTDEINEKGGYFVFDSRVFFSQEFIRLALLAIQSRTSNCQFYLPANSFNDRYILPSNMDQENNHVLDLKYVMDCGSQEYELISVQQKIFEYVVSLPSQIIKSEKYHMDQSEVFAMHIDTPFHLLMANLAANFSRLAKAQNKVPRLLGNRFTSRKSKFYFRLLRSMNKIGKNCSIHPSAIIEGSILGDNVTIEANAIVRFSNINDNCVIGDNVVVRNSIVGKKSVISVMAFINCCLIYDEVLINSGIHQFSVFGKNVSCHDVGSCDFRSTGINIFIHAKTGLIDSKQQILGVAYGHECSIGAGIYVAPGRIIPNGTKLVPKEIVR